MRPHEWRLDRWTLGRAVRALKAIWRSPSPLKQNAWRLVMHNLAQKMIERYPQDLSQDTAALPPETMDVLIEFARKRKRRDFFTLAGAAGVPIARREGLWAGLRRRLGAGRSKQKSSTLRTGTSTARAPSGSANGGGRGGKSSRSSPGRQARHKYLVTLEGETESSEAE